MPIIKIYKVADIIDGEIVFSPSAKKFIPGVKGYGMGSSFDRTFEYSAGWTLLKLYPSTDPMKEEFWRPHDFLHNLNRYLQRSSFSGTNPLFIPENKPTQLVYFRDRLFMSERVASASERPEVVLRVKKAVYEEETELSGLRAAVANMGAAVEFQRSGPKRDPIPEDVKLLVWGRDGGPLRTLRIGAGAALRPYHPCRKRAAAILRRTFRFSAKRAISRSPIGSQCRNRFFCHTC